MPVVKEPLTASCFRCNKNLLIKFVPPHKEYSKKNNWGYWTEKEEDKEKYICDKCLKTLYKKHKWSFSEEVKSLKKRQMFRNYVHSRFI